MIEIRDGINKQPSLNIQKIYRQASSFEIFNLLESFKQSFRPENQLQINIQTNVLEQEAYEVILNTDVLVKHQDKNLFNDIKL